MLIFVNFAYDNGEKNNVQNLNNDQINTELQVFIIILSTKSIANANTNDISYITAYRTNIINVFFYYGEMTEEMHEQEGSLDFYQFLGKVTDY